MASATFITRHMQPYELLLMVVATYALYSNRSFLITTLMGQIAVRKRRKAIIYLWTR